jgi:serine/threonine protein kinase
MNHKHIAELYGYFHDDYFVYLVMEYCPNANLFYYLKNFHPLPETEIAKYISLLIYVFRLFLELTAGVDYIH